MGAFPDDEEVRTFVAQAVEEHADPTARLLYVLEAVQERFRYVPEAAVEEAAVLTGVPENIVRGWCEAFAYLSIDPVGEYLVEVCDGTACHMQGSERLVSEFEKALGVVRGGTTPDGRVTLRIVNCIGACGMAPAVVAGGQIFGRTRVTRVGDIVRTVVEGKSR